MKSYPPEPLTPEERELAQLTGHLGPQGEPSTALDARILAAAHAALDRKQLSRRKPRWPVAMGLAASVIFAVGIAWQLRPLQQAPVLVSAETPAPVVEQEAMAADSAAAAVSNGPSAPEADVADLAGVDEAAPAPASPALAEQMPVPQAKGLAPPSESRMQPPGQTIRSATRASKSSSAQEQIGGNVSMSAAAPPPPAPPAPVAMVAAPAPVPEAPASFAPDPTDGYSARAATADMAAAGASAAKPQAEALAEAKSARANSSARQKEGVALERVEVSGSRMKRTDLQVPVSDDAALPVNEWLERVRTRYGLGDAGAAKQSLLLFVKDHPSEPVPGDLEPLLEE